MAASRVSLEILKETKGPRKVEKQSGADGSKRDMDIIRSSFVDVDFKSELERCQHQL